MQAQKSHFLQGQSFQNPQHLLEETKVDVKPEQSCNGLIPEPTNEISPFDIHTTYTSEVLKLETGTGIVGYAMQFVKSKGLFCIGTKDGCLLIYDVYNFKLLQKHSAIHKTWIISLNYCEALDLLISTSSDRLIKVWKIDKENIVEIAKLEGHKDAANAVLIIPETKAMLSVGRDPDIKIWDMECFKLKGVIETGEGGMGCSIIQIQELNCIGVSFFSGKIKLFNIQQKECTLTIETGHNNYYINSLLYLPKRRWIIAQVSAKEIRVWERNGVEFAVRGTIKTEGHANFMLNDENEDNIIFACDKPCLDVYELGCLMRSNKINFGETPLKNSNGLVYIKELSKLVVCAWNTSYINVLKYS